MRAGASRRLMHARCVVPAALLLAGCSITDRSSSRAPETSLAKDAAARPVANAGPPRVSDARDIDGYKRDAARRINFTNSALLFDGAPPPTLKSVVVLAIRIGPEGKLMDVVVVRSNGYTDLDYLALKSVRAADPLPVPRAALLMRGSLEYYETWLFRDDHRFQIRSLAEAQQLAD